MAPTLEQHLIERMWAEQLDMACGLGMLKARVDMLETALSTLQSASGRTISPTSSPPPKPKVSLEVLVKAGELLAHIGPPLWRGILWLLPRAISWGGILWGLWSTAWQMLGRIILS